MTQYEFPYVAPLPESHRVGFRQIVTDRGVLNLVRVVRDGLHICTSIEFVPEKRCPCCDVALRECHFLRRSHKLRPAPTAGGGLALCGTSDASTFKSRRDGSESRNNQPKVKQ